MEQEAALRGEIEMLELQLEEEAWIRANEEPSMSSCRSHLGLRVYGAITTGYLFVNALSVRTPGPAHVLGLDSHVRLFSHLGRLLRYLGIG
jgi:hypothetical protein